LFSVILITSKHGSKTDLNKDVLEVKTNIVSISAGIISAYGMTIQFFKKIIRKAIYVIKIPR